MLANYFKVALRTLLKHKGYTFINVAGLAVGMAAGLLIFLSVRHDLTFDRFHTKADRLARVLSIDRALGVTSQHVGITMPALGPTLVDQLPEVEQSARLLGQGRQLFSLDDVDFYADQVFLAENTLFELFDFPLLRGDPARALVEPNTTVLTRSFAQTLFGDEDPIGKTVSMSQTTDLTVTGVVEDPPSTSHLDFDVLVSMVPTPEQENFQQFLLTWNSIAAITYVLLDEPERVHALDDRIEEIVRANDVNPAWSATLQPLTDVHLRSSSILFDTNRGKSDLNYVYALAIVAVFVLLIAAFNFMNLATARSAERAREVGLRKVVGAHRTQLMVQHLGESVLVCTAAFLIAIGLVEAALPVVNAAMGKDLALDLLTDPGLSIGLLGGMVVLALFAGSYPAFVLTGFKPVTVLKGAFRTSAQGRLLRKTLVVTQFAASVAMIIGTVIVSQQLSYIQERNMGYNRDQVLVLNLNSGPLQETAPTLRDELLRHPSITKAAMASSVPGRQLGRTGVTPEGGSEDDTWIMSIMSVDDRFFDTMEMELAAGRVYSEAFGTDEQEAVIINEAARQALGWTEAVGKHLTIGDQEREVIGVVSDFNYASVRHQVEPLLLMYQPGANGVLTVKIESEDLAGTLAFVEETWAGLNPDYPFEYSFLNEEFNQLYQEEANFATLARGFTVLAIVIACLGLFGLAAFTAQQRVKEIGVRKVMGASVPSLLVLLSKDFAGLVGIAFVIASPVAYLALNRWLDDFVYRIEIGPMIFLAAGGLALLIALLTVGYQSIRAALANPVDSLRYE